MPRLSASKPVTVIENATIYTMDRATPQAESLAWRDGKILAAGSLDEVKDAVAGAEVRRVDLGGRTVIPGLIDAHIHALGFSRSLKKVSLDGVTSKEEALRLVAEKVRASKPGEWVVGGGWNNNLWSPPGFPTRHDLDRIAPQNPVYLDRKDLHSCWVNTLALERAGVSKQTPDPPGSRIGRDENGELDGMFFESAVALVSRAARDATENPVELLRDGIRAMAAMGLVGFHNCQGQDIEADSEGPGSFVAFQQLDRAGELKARVVTLIPWYELQNAIEMGLCTGFGSERLRVGPVKLFSDGSLGSMTAEMLEDYEGRPGYRGIRTIPQETLEEAIFSAVRAGIPAAVHAIGDDANRRVLNTFARARELEPAGSRLVHRIEHAQIVDPADVPRFAALGVVASMQPLHATSDMHAADRLWGERSRYSYGWRSLLDAGAMLAFGSDAPVETPNPFAGIHAAVTRQDENDQPESGWYPNERITVEESVRAYTEGAARSAPYLPDVTGTLTPGSAADFLVLDCDIFEIPPSDIKSMKPLATVVGGEAVFQSDGIF